MAQIGYARAPSFEVDAPGQRSNAERIEHAVRTEPVLRDAVIAEGLARVWELEDSRGDARGRGHRLGRTARL